MIRKFGMLAGMLALSTAPALAGTVSVRNNGVIIDFRKSLGSQAIMAIELVRTRRVPEDGRVHKEPPHLGALPTRLARTIPRRFHNRAWINRDVILAPVGDKEAMWLNFKSPSAYGYTGIHVSHPFAVMIATGKRNVITAEPLRLRLRATRATSYHNYVTVGVLDKLGYQRWVDGYQVADGEVRQFVAVRPGSGLSVESYMTGRDHFGGIQIIVWPMTHRAWQAELRRRSRARVGANRSTGAKCIGCGGGKTESMTVGAGGRIEQVIHYPAFPPSAYQAKPVKFWIELVHRSVWPTVTDQIDCTRVLANAPSATGRVNPCAKWN